MDARGRDLAALLTELGLDAASALTLVHLSRVEDATVRGLVDATGLTQPSVSVATKDLRRRGWVDKEEERRHRHGRPLHRYRLAVDVARAVDELEADHHARIREDEEALASLRKYLG